MDVLITHCGNVLMFKLVSEAARAWVNDNVEVEGWQWMGNAIAVDQHYAQDLAQAMSEAGLEVR